MSQVAQIRPELILVSLLNIKQLGVLLLPTGWDASLYSRSKVERHCESKVS